MARLSLLDEGEHPELGALIEKIRSGRRGNLLDIYRSLLVSPPIAAAWFDFMNTVRWKTELPGRLRELLIIRIALLNRAAYVLGQHVPLLAKADGVSEAECEALKAWRESPAFSEPERAALAYADAMTEEVNVPDAVFEGLRPHFSERHILELTVLIGAYNMHTRYVQALDFAPETKKA